MSFSLGTILAQLVIFLLLMVLIAWKAVGPVVAIMDKRKKYINSQITTAEKSREDSQKYLELQKEELDKVRRESHEMIEQAKSQANAEAKAIIEAAKNRSDLMIKDANEEIGLEKEKAIAAIRDEVADLSVMLASKVLEKEINPKDYSNEIDQLMKQVGNQR
ncbi:F0F1 ATP synthase subunit B [Sporolactobacillus shoreicorticis]|uniref:ATP synthase subunit b n=1 Tax=Sporolactobacillus shoreicorticis TaxID=1923877 RepID=A0ABW5S7M3_9BACL|nr:F0F1 ATP synthase subunit B [Sporolactobacillus shoreicorticis]MCO7125616.1 F0F1 ATP synthase subunit B [Sporolactobacillus shoreicorticis]